MRDAVEFGATEICMQSGIHPDWTIADYESWLRVAKDDRAGAPPARLLADGDRPPRGGPAARRGVRPAARGRPGLTARHRRRGAARRRAPAHLAEQAAGGALGGDHRGGPRGRPALHGHRDVRPHRGALGAGRAHARGALGCRSARAASPSSCRSRSSPSTRCSGRTHGIEEISREENLKHTAAFRLALGRTIPSLQASWVKMGLDAATEALRWGVNDLGGTLMEESISRMAGSYHGVMLEPARPDRRRPRAPAGPPPSATRSTASAGATSCRSRPDQAPTQRIRAPLTLGVEGRCGEGRCNAASGSSRCSSRRRTSARCRSSSSRRSCSRSRTSSNSSSDSRPAPGEVPPRAPGASLGGGGWAASAASSSAI